LLPRFDLVILMEHGRIIDRGRPDEMHSRQAGFFAYWRTQVAAELQTTELRA
jgi:ABC-type multidrug transport system fused ATPase/permease subunit